MPRKLMFLMMFLFTMLPLAGAQAESMVVDGRMLDWYVEPITVEGQALVPLEPLCKELGYKITLGSEQDIFTAEKQRKGIVIDLRESRAMLNGSEVSLSATPQSQLGTTLLALADIDRLFGTNSYWDKEFNRVSLYTPYEEEREGIVKQLLTADNQMMRAIYYNNPDFLKQVGIASPPQIDSKSDLEGLLSPYWSERYIEDLWQEGSRAGHYIGFFCEGPMPLQYNKEIDIRQFTETGAVVAVTLPGWGDETLMSFEERLYTFSKQADGRMLITNIEYK